MIWGNPNQVIYFYLLVAGSLSVPLKVGLGKRENACLLLCQMEES